MASALDQKQDPAAKFGSVVDEQITQATGRIRVHDLTLGGLVLVALVAVYATGMILLDRYLNLAEWVRQLALFGFLAALGGVGYLLVVRPLRKQINPLYAAARVEKTIDDPKNSVMGYVEAQEKGDVHAAIKAAMSARAARALDDADVNRAVDHRSLLVAGGVLVAFLLALVVLFFVFRPAQFGSLMGRAFVPFSSDPIATRTQITLLKPEPPDPTLTTGQTITVAVHVGGKVPAKDGPTRVRVLIRHNPADPNYEELPMQEGETTRDWQVKVPEYLVQNGFWYKVAAGDAETPEYRVNVRSLPLFTDFEATFVYPAYTNKPDDKSRDAHIRNVYRGTLVTLVAKTNREVKDGTLRFGIPGHPPVPGTPAPGKPDSLEFRFTITDPTRYQLFMTTTAGERNADSPWFNVTLDTDDAPVVQITRPEDVESTAPANGQLAVDGNTYDDFGVDKVRLRMRVDGRDLAPLFYMDGTSLRREKDNTWPGKNTPFDFKLSADLTKLAYADGAKFEPREGVVVEFWAEAIDNCTQTPPVEGWGEKPQPGNVGRSQVYRLTLTPPKTDEADKQQLDQRKEQRRNEERQHNQQQQKKFDNEPRDSKPQQQDGKGGEPPPQGQPKQDDQNPKKDGKSDPKSGTGGMGGDKNDSPPPKKDDKTDPKSDPIMGGAGGTPDQKTDPKSDPKSDPKMGMGGAGGTGGANDQKKDPDAKTPPGQEPKKDDTPPMGGGMNTTGTGGMDQAPAPKTPEEKQHEQDAKRVQEELNRNKAEGGDAKPNTGARPEDRTDPGQPKPQPMQGGEPDSQPKQGPKPGDPANPMTKGDTGASDSKPAGNLEKQTDPAEPKPMPNLPDPKDPGKKPAQPSETRSEPLGSSPGTDKPEPKTDGMSQPKEPDKNTDPMSGSASKPATDRKDGDAGTQPKEPPPGAGQPKPNPEPARGADREPEQPKGGQPAETKPKDDPAAGDAKPQQQPPSGATKPPVPKDGADKAKEPDPSDAKPGPPDDKTPMGGASEPRQPPQPMGGGNAVDPGMDRDEGKPPPGAGDPKDKKDLKGGGADPKQKELTGQQRRELEEAAKNLNNPDPKKREEAQKKLDDAIGQDKRKELEQLQKDLNSPDKDKRDAAEKKLDDLKNQAQQGKHGDGGKGLSPEDIAGLQKKAPDLNSKDDGRRQAAEKEFDDKLGKDAREKLQEQMKNQPMMDPMSQEELKKQLEEMAKNNPGRGKGPIDLTKESKGPGSSTDAPKGPIEDDPRNRAKTAQLQLEEFEKHRYDHDLREKLGWDPKKWEDFLKAERQRVEQLAKEADAYEEALRTQPTTPAGPPTITAGGAGKVDERPNVTGVTGTSGGATFAPPGFEDAKRKFAEEAAKLKKKQ